MRDRSGNEKRQCTKQPQHNPAESDTDHSFLCMKASFRTTREGNHDTSYQSRNQRGEKQCMSRYFFLIVEDDRICGQHENRLYEKNLSDKLSNHFIIHCSTPQKYHSTDRSPHPCSSQRSLYRPFHRKNLHRGSPAFLCV